MTSFLVVIAIYVAIASIAMAITNLMPFLDDEKESSQPHYKEWAIIDNEFVEYEEALC